MNWKRDLGLGLIIMGLYIVIAARIFTGAVIGFSPQNYISLVGVGIFILGVILVLASGTLERRVEDEIGEHYEAHGDVYETGKSGEDRKSRLTKRLSEMEKQRLIGVDPKKVPTGRNLTRSEEKKIYNIIWKYLPSDLKQSKDLEISITGSLSIAGGGKRKPGKYDIKGQLESDQFYLSDIDVQIAGKPIFDYIEANWGSAVIRHVNKRYQGGGRLKNIATYKITSDEYLNDREKEVGYMREAPDWIKSIVKEFGESKFIGQKRPVNIKFFKDKGLLGGGPRDILYEA